MRVVRRRSIVLTAAIGLLATVAMSPVAAADPQKAAGPSPKFSSAAAFDVSPALSAMAASSARRAAPADPDAEPVDIRPDRGPVVEDQGYSGDGALQGAAARLAAPATALDDPGSDRQLRGHQQPGQLQHLRLPRQPARSGRRRRPESLRRDGQPRLRRLRQAGQPAAGTGRYRHAVGRLRRRGLHRSLGRPDRASTTSSRIAGSSASSRRAGPIVLQLRRDLADRRSDRRLLPLRVHHSAGSGLDGGYFFPDYPKYGVWTDSYIMTTRDFGRRRPSTASASTRSRRTR